MNFTQLNYLIAVAKYRNFTLAAKELYVTQPAITHQIRELEKELNVKLFIRNPKKVELTPEGEIFLEDAKRAVSIIEQSKQKIWQSSFSEAKTLDIAYLASSHRSYLPYVVDKFHRANPSYSVNMIRCDAAGISNAVREQKYDIYCSVTEEMMMFPELSVKTIFADYFCLITQPSHPAVSDLSIDYRKLSSEPFVLFSPEGGAYMYHQIMQTCEHLGFSPRVVKTYGFMEEVLYAVASGIGITILPYRTRGYIDNDLSYTLLDAPNISVSCCVAWHTETRNPAVRLFLEALQETRQTHPEYF